MLGRRVKLLRLLTRRWTFSGLGAAGSSPGHVASCSESGCSCRGSVQRWLLLRDLLLALCPLSPPRSQTPKFCRVAPSSHFHPTGCTMRPLLLEQDMSHSIYQGPWRWVWVFLTPFWGVFQVPPCSCSTRSRCSFTQRELHVAARQPGCGAGRGSDRTSVRDFHFLQTKPPDTRTGFTGTPLPESRKAAERRAVGAAATTKAQRVEFPNLVYGLHRATLEGLISSSGGSHVFSQGPHSRMSCWACQAQYLGHRQVKTHIRQH